MDEHTKHHIHESPKRVVYPLFALAILSVVGGYVGLPGWTGMSSGFERFLEPVLRLPVGREMTAVHLGGQELLFTCLSVLVAVLGIFIAYRLYVVNPEIPGRMATRFSRLYSVIYHKYYVDELYDALFVNRAKDLGDACYFVDSKFVDGAVNGTAATTRGTATVSRVFDKYVVDGLVNFVGWINMALNRLATSLQTGLVQRYALGAVLGILVFILICYNGLFKF